MDGDYKKYDAEYNHIIKYLTDISKDITSNSKSENLISNIDNLIKLLQKEENLILRNKIFGINDKYINNELISKINSVEKIIKQSISDK